MRSERNGVTTSGDSVPTGQPTQKPLRFGRRLSPIELAAYDLVPQELREGVRVLRVPFVPGGYAGLTLGSWIFLARDVDQDGTSTLLAHELVHVQQYADQGFVGYLARYLGAFFPDLIRKRNWNEAYSAIPAEVEARARTTDWQHRQRR